MNDLFLIFEKIIHCLCFLLDMAVLIVKTEEKNGSIKLFKQFKKN